jgi:CheY-like chemotaxis protein
VRTRSGPMPSPGVGGPESVPRAPRLLVVDDNRDAALAMAELVTQFGFETRTAHDAAEAISIAMDFAPETALIDLGLPDLDGYSLATRLRRLREHRAPLRLIAVTGYGQASDRARSVLAGFDAHIVKPVGAQTLHALICDTPQLADPLPG